MKAHYHIDLEKISLLEFKNNLESRDMIPSRASLKEELDDRFEILEDAGVTNLKDLVTVLKTKSKILKGNPHLLAFLHKNFGRSRSSEVLVHPEDPKLMALRASFYKIINLPKGYSKKVDRKAMFYKTSLKTVPGRSFSVQILTKPEPRMVFAVYETKGSRTTTPVYKEFKGSALTIAQKVKAEVDNEISMDSMKYV